MPRFSDFFSNIFKRRGEELKTRRIVSAADIDGIVKGYYRPYQMDMWRRFKDSLEDVRNDVEKNFLFQAGTGTGKTEIFKFISPYLLARAADEGDGEGKVFGLVCHRLCLIKDLGTRIMPTLIHEYSANSKDYWSGDSLAGCALPKEKIKFYYVNSGKKLTIQDKELATVQIDGKYVNTMDQETLEREIAENRRNGIHSFFICLYQSIAEYGNTKMKNIKFDWVICDEIHTINTSKTDEYNMFFQCAEFFDRASIGYYFTATPVYDNRDKRQDNFGIQRMTSAAV